MTAAATRRAPLSLPAGGARGSRRARLRDDLERSILIAAEKVFAEKGFAGSPIATIADAAGISKQNLMYYFPTKLSLYRRVLGDVLEDWLQSMHAFAHSERTLEQALADYIRAKLEFSRRRPHGSRVYALEVIGGAKTYGREIKAKVVPALREDIAMLKRWTTSTHGSQVSAEHLFFIIWAATQSYADFAAQMHLILGKQSLNDEDFEQANTTLTLVVLGAMEAST